MTVSVNVAFCLLVSFYVNTATSCKHLLYILHVAIIVTKKH